VTKGTGHFAAAWWALLVCGVLAGASCTPDGPAASSAPALKPLPPEAKLPLDKLSPVLAKPVNAPGWDDLPPRVADSVRQAEQLLAQRQYARAIDLLERAAGFDPANARIRRALGLAYFHLPNWGKALENLRQSAEKRGDDLEVQLAMGRLYAGQKQKDQAVLALRTALLCSEADPSDPRTGEAVIRLAKLLDEQGYWTAALECYVRMEEWIDRHGQAYASQEVLQDYVLQPELLLAERGRLLLRLRRPADAAEPLDRAYRRNRASEPTAKLLIQALTDAGKYPQAEQTLVEMASQPVLSRSVPDMAEALCHAAGDPKMPARIWQAFRQRNRKAGGRLAWSMAAAAERLGALDEASSILRSLLDEMPGDSTAATMLADLYLRQNRIDDALTLVATVLATDPASDLGRWIAPRVAAARPGADVALARQAAADASGGFAKHYLAGELSLASGRQEQAIEQFQAALRANPKFFPAYESLMDLYVAQRQFPKVDALLESLKAFAEDSPFPYYIRGKFALLRRQVPAAVELLEQARVRDRADVRVALLLADAYAQAGQVNDAERVLLSALEQGEPPLVFRALFDLYLSRGERDKAQSVASRVVARDPQGAAGQLMTARLLLAGGEKARAVEILKRLREQDADNLEVRLLLVEAELSGREPTAAELDAAIAEIGRIVRLRPDNDHAHKLLAELLARGGKHEQAADVWKRLYEDTARQTDVARAYAAALLRAERFEQAENVLRELLTADPKDFPARQMLLVALDKLEKTGQARDLVEAWLEQEQEISARPWYRQKLLELYETRKEYDRAQKLLDAWIDTTVEENLLRALRGRKLMLYGKAGQFDRACEFTEQWGRQKTTERDLARQVLIQTLAEGKQFDRGQKLLDQWIGDGKDPSLKPLRYRKMELYRQAQQIDELVKYGLAWAREAPDDPLPRQTLVVVLVSGEQYDRAVSLLEGWLAEGATTRPATAPATQASQPAGTDDEHRRWMREMVLRVLSIQGKFEQVAALADEYLRAAPDDAELLLLQGNALSELGRIPEAISAMEKALALRPDDPSVCNNLGYFYADRGVELAKAERLIRKALAARATEAAFLDSLGWVFYKQGRFREAVSVFETVLTQMDDQKDSPVIYDHAGDAYWRDGQKDRAISAWKKAVELAEKDKSKSSEVETLRKLVPAKLQAAASGKAPTPAPLGEGVKDNPSPR